MNLKSVWLLSQAAGQHMVPRRRGKIINFCSLLTFQVRLPPCVSTAFILQLLSIVSGLSPSVAIPIPT